MYGGPTELPCAYDCPVALPYEWMPRRFLQGGRIQAELHAARGELSQRVALAAGAADAMLTNAAGALRS